MRIPIPERVLAVMRVLDEAGGQPMLVGGFVRDRVMAELRQPVMQSKDVDLEVRLEATNLLRVLRTMGTVNLVGLSFAVFKLTLPSGEQMDVSIPRRDSSTGAGHNMFEVTGIPTLNIREAAERRDFTMNSMAADINGLVHDPFNGTSDIVFHVLRATSTHFDEDPLRVLRGMQFASRFGMRMDAGTIDMSRSLMDAFQTLSGDRVGQEMFKWARGATPSRGLQLLDDTRWLMHFPEIEDLLGLAQDNVWHPEGDVLEHTTLTVDQAANIARRENLTAEQTKILVLAALLHDVGKATTTSINSAGRIISHGHAQAGETMARTFMNRLHAPDRVTRAVSRLVGEHMVHTSAQPTATNVRRLAQRLDGTSVAMLALLTEADASARFPAPPASPMAEWARVAETLHVAQSGPQRLILGRHLIALGMQPGPYFGPIIDAAFEAQLNSEFDNEDDGIEWVKRHFEHERSF
jgi:tRNA nucleotidyltransferase (CCA-adding enzyme)